MSKRNAGKRQSVSLLSLVEGLEERRLMAAPALDAINNANVPAGKSLIIPLTASDADGDKLTYTVTSDNAKFTIVQHNSNPFLKLNVSYTDASNVAHTGTILIELFKDVAPTTVKYIESLALGGFYNGLTFHRVISGFMIQGGDPAGTGSGGPGFQFSDEFNSDAIFSGTGQLAMANSGDDTNGSQFFITTGSQRHLDFNHTIFGQVVRGMDVVTAISNVPVTSEKPNVDVKITSAQIVQDQQDAVITVKAASDSAAATGTITVQVDDGHGGTSTRTFTVTGASDSSNSDLAFLNPISTKYAKKDKPITITLSGTDIDSTIVGYNLTLVGSNANIEITRTALAAGSNTTGVTDLYQPAFTVKPKNGFTGVVYLTAKVYRSGSTNANADLDTQTFALVVGKPAVALHPVAAKANAGVGQNVTVAKFAAPTATAKASDYTAVINWGQGYRSYGSISKVGTQFVVKGGTPYSYKGTYDVQVSLYLNSQTADIAQGRAGIASTFTTAAIRPIAVIPDLVTKGKTALLINGTPEDDTILVAPAAGGAYAVTVNGVAQGTFKPTGRILVLSGGGNDTITVDPKVGLSAELYGGSGNDTITGARGKDILSGGSGDDSLQGAGATDLLIGGPGKDVLSGGSGDDVLIADRAGFDLYSGYEASIINEMSRAASYASRVSHLKGPKLGLNQVKLGSTTVSADDQADSLSGGAGNDLFVANKTAAAQTPADVLQDKATSETVLDV